LIMKTQQLKGASIEDRGKFE